MKYRLLLCLILATSLQVAVAQGGEQLSLRLVEASNTTDQIDERLNDVKAILSNLPFRTYQLLDAKIFRLPANEEITMRNGYQVICRGEQNNLRIRIYHNRKELVDTTLALVDGRPFVQTLLPTENGRMLLVVLAR